MPSTYLSRDTKKEDGKAKTARERSHAKSRVQPQAEFAFRFCDAHRFGVTPSQARTLKYCSFNSIEVTVTTSGKGD